MLASVLTRHRPIALLPESELDDDYLVRWARAGDRDAVDMLITRYGGYARAKAKTYFLMGADSEDIVQEGMIGLFKAIRDYDPTRTGSFRAFAELCITRQVITAIKGATRQKHHPLNSYVSLHRCVGPESEDGDRQLVESLASARLRDPLDVVVATDEAERICEFLVDILSEFETQVLGLYLEGKSYEQIARRLRRRAKSIDNALQRIKRKLDIFLRRRAAAVEDEVRSPLLNLSAVRTESGRERGVRRAPRSRVHGTLSPATARTSPPAA